MLFFLLYFSIINERVQTEIDNLLSRGISHRDVLEKSFDSLTIKHVALMESEAETMVIITGHDFNVINSSNTVTSDKLELIQIARDVDFSHHGIVLESDWKTASHLATVSPVRINEENNGYVFMFLNTESLSEMIKNVTTQFYIVGAIATVFSLLTIGFLSRFITLPLIQMKKVTENLSKGKGESSLDIHREDELGDLARSIQRLADDLEHLKKDRFEFLSSVSHELRTPLTYLKGYADILKRPNLSEKEREEFLTIIQEEATNVNALIKDLFDLAKMDQNEFSIQKERIHLCDLLQDISVKFKPAYEQKRVSLTFTCEDGINILLDPVRFNQVMKNLVDNALKYSSINTNVLVQAYKKDEEVIVKVSDQGEGIPKSEIPFIWDRLYRVDKSRSRTTGGSGLGLTIAKEIIERHGGTIQVESVVGKGTTFTIHLQGE